MGKKVRKSRREHNGSGIDRTLQKAIESAERLMPGSKEFIHGEEERSLEHRRESLKRLVRRSRLLVETTTPAPLRAVKGGLPARLRAASKYALSRLRAHLRALDELSPIIAAAEGMRRLLSVAGDRMPALLRGSLPAQLAAARGAVKSLIAVLEVGASLPARAAHRPRTMQAATKFARSLKAAGFPSRRIAAELVRWGFVEENYSDDEVRAGDKVRALLSKAERRSRSPRSPETK